MYLKIMSGEDAPDGDSRKCFRLIDDVLDVEFGRLITPAGEKLPANRLIANQGPTVKVFLKNGTPAETVHLEGNAYLMNEAGETIASFGVCPYMRPRRRD
jgi:hypothetical protein